MLRILARLDIYFMPVFCLTIDAEVFRFTVKKIKKMCRTIGDFFSCFLY